MHRAKPNKGLELTASSVRSCVAPASGSSSDLAFGSYGERLSQGEGIIPHPTRAHGVPPHCSREVFLTVLCQQSVFMSSHDVYGT
jgi:hypothetical protein